MPILYAVGVLGLILFGFEGIERFEVEHFLLLLFFGLVAGSSRSHQGTPRPSTPVRLYTPVTPSQHLTSQPIAPSTSNVIVAEQPFYTDQNRN